MRIVLALLMVAAASGAIAAPRWRHMPPRPLVYRTNFDPVTVERPVQAAPFAADRRYLPPALNEAPVARPRAALRIRGRGVRVRMRIPIG